MVRIALVYLLLLAGFGWGIAVGRYEAWPFQHLQEVAAFARGHPEEPRSSVLKKMVSDFGGIPYRYLVDDPVDTFVDTSPVRPVTLASFGIDSFIRLQTRSDIDGLVLLSGSFRFTQGPSFGAVLIDVGAGELRRVWQYQDAMEIGFAIDRGDGSIYADVGPQIVKFAWCGDMLWESEPRDYHHSVELDDEGRVWTWQGWDIAVLDGSTGALVRTITSDDVFEANADIGVLDQRFAMTWDTEADPQQLRPQLKNLKDPYHHNDAEPLPRALAGHYDAFEPGDLLISLRSLNLVGVMDPTSLQVKWWSQGHFQRQHDPDWAKDGQIYVYDNRPFRPFSHLAAIAADAVGHDARQVVVDGESINWHEPSRGNHDIVYHQGNRLHLIVDDRDGRALLVSPEDGLQVEIQSLLDEDSALNVRSALWVSREEFERFEGRCNDAGTAM